MLKKCASRIYMVLIFAFLYLPIIVLIALSFNDSRSKVKWGGFTLRWYTGCFQDEKIMTAFVTTLQVTFLSAIISTLIGTLAALGIAAMKKRHQTIYLGATNIPLLNADIVTGISMMLLFVKFIDLGFVTVLLAHITFSIPYVILNVLPKMKQTNRSTYEAALDLGATPLYAFYKVTWPEIRPGVFSGFMMAVTMSLDDFPSPILPKEPGSIPSPPCSTQNFAKESNRNCMHFPRFCSLPFCSFFLPEMFIRGRSVLQPNKFSIGILFQPKGVLL